MASSRIVTPPPRAVSIITCTNRPACMSNLFHNYSRQLSIQKELIVILNNDKMKLSKYQEFARKYANVRIYQLPQRISLGKCLNFAVQKASYDYVAKFDDDDYYAPYYLVDSLQEMYKTQADIVGKRAHFMYLEGPKSLLLRYYNQERQYTSMVQGATLIVRRQVFDQVTFSNRNVRESIRFCLDCMAKGFKIFAGSRFNFAAIRSKNPKDHTWTISAKQLLSQKTILFRPNNFKALVTRHGKAKAATIL